MDVHAQNLHCAYYCCCSFLCNDECLSTILHINASAANINHCPAALLAVNAAHQQCGISLKGYKDQSQTKICFAFHKNSIWSCTSHFAKSMIFGFCLLKAHCVCSCLITGLPQSVIWRECLVLEQLIMWWKFTVLLSSKKSPWTNEHWSWSAALINAGEHPDCFSVTPDWHSHIFWQIFRAPLELQEIHFANDQQKEHNTLEHCKQGTENHYK